MAISLNVCLRMLECEVDEIVARLNNAEAHGKPYEDADLQRLYVLNEAIDDLQKRYDEEQK